MSTHTHSLTLSHTHTHTHKYTHTHNSIYHHSIYFMFKQKPVAVTVRALYDYTQRRADELTFEEGDIITNVEKREG